MSLQQLLLELSAVQRYQTVKLLSQSERRPTEITSEVGLSKSEMSRHSSRLQAHGLIEKSANGYKKTMLGNLTLQQLNAIDFFMKRRDYFQNHMWEALPRVLLCRIHPSGEAQFVKGVENTLRAMERLIRSTKHYLLFITCDIHENFLAPILEKLEEGIRVRLVIMEDVLQQLDDFFGEHPK